MTWSHSHCYTDVSFSCQLLHLLVQVICPKFHIGLVLVLIYGPIELIVILQIMKISQILCSVTEVKAPGGKII